MQRFPCPECGANNWKEKVDSYICKKCGKIYYKMTLNEIEDFKKRQRLKKIKGRR